jgi:hypothetical protein
MVRKQRLPRGKPPSQRACRPEPDESDDYDPNDIRYIATHEAAHAVAAIVYGVKLTSVDLKKRKLPGGRISVGFTRTPPVPFEAVAGKGEAVALPFMVQGLVGPLAEAGVNPGLVSADDGSCSKDIEDAKLTATVAVCDCSHEGSRSVISPEEIERKRPRLKKLMADATDAAAQFVSDHGETIVEVANALIEKRELSGEEVAAIVNVKRMIPI